MIDIVLPWLNGNDKHWQNDYMSTVSKISGGDKGIIRVREWDIFKYFLRSIAKNCKFVRKIHIIVYDEHQIPDWINTSNDKINFVLHKDIIPTEFLPTYNSLVPAMFVTNIKDLAENFIYCNDDMFFVNEMKEKDFFINEKPVKLLNKLTRKESRYWEFHDTWCRIMQNTIEIYNKLFSTNTLYEAPHVPTPYRKKDYMKCFDMLKPFHKRLFGNFNDKIRQPNNLCMAEFVEYYESDFTDTEKLNNYRNLHQLINITEKPDWNKIFYALLNAKTICFNDQCHTTNNMIFNDIKTKLIKILNSVFPDKCEFEK